MTFLRKIQWYHSLQIQSGRTVPLSNLNIWRQDVGPTSVTSGLDDLSQPYSGSEKSTPCLGLASRTSSSSLRLALTSCRSSCLSSSSIILSSSLASSTGLGPRERTAFFWNYFCTVPGSLRWTCVAYVAMRIRIQHFRPMWIRVGIQSFNDQKSNIAIYVSRAFIKDVQAKNEAFSPQKRTSGMIFFTFS